MTENLAKISEVPTTKSDSPSMPIKVIVSPSKKFQSAPVSTVQPSLKNLTQPFVTQHQPPTLMVIYLIEFMFLI